MATLVPWPMPVRVISSAIHIRQLVPAARGNTVTARYSGRGMASNRGAALGRSASAVQVACSRLQARPSRRPSWDTTSASASLRHWRRSGERERAKERAKEAVR